MSLLYCLLIAALLCQFPKFIQHNRIALYTLATIITTVVTIYELIRLITGYQLEGFVRELERAVSHGVLSIAFFIPVMFAGALNNRWSYTRRLKSIRSPLAIIASILMLAHGLVYLVRFLVRVSSMLSSDEATILRKTIYLGYSLIGIVAFVLMIPLFITSFRKVRSRIGGPKWRKIQRWAYLFYLLTYLHVLLILIMDKDTDWLRLMLYTGIFGSYTILRLMKYRETNAVGQPGRAKGLGAVE
ncbi:DMSO/TMAO reductase YedYZ heme-binding membrane subunit [Paenibacillus forsythiae]|uniref:DMSO/TMAO reductase YedYZ heme-binding membrane subunit n=1 Tax=Paenibacillus forsythiae TaxID=365616 RepID=A0ABU3HAH3_9BACL|nr:ferric reductase-like transmembrane domain-containing protein [Paenibacillus forsythiae]MDT3426690.1 DMSO/TMAO reductase YedYZ heme-binding membrane subunit [Paenibacillus forsythiae]